MASQKLLILTSASARGKMARLLGEKLGILKGEISQAPQALCDDDGVGSHIFFHRDVASKSGRMSNMTGLFQAIGRLIATKEGEIGCT